MDAILKEALDECEPLLHVMPRVRLDVNECIKFIALQPRGNPA